MANVSTNTPAPKTLPQEDNISSNDSTKLVINEATKTTNESDDESHKTDETNVTKDLNLDANDNDTADNTSQMDVSDDETNETQRIIESYTLTLPRIQDVLKQAEAEHENMNQTNDERITRKGKFAKAVLNTPLNSGNHTLEKGNQHHEKEKRKTLYGYYNSGEDNIPVTNVDLLTATAGHVKQKHIEPFYKISKGMFIIVLILTIKDFIHRN